jgi:formate C-acetyltransferase
VRVYQALRHYARRYAQAGQEAGLEEAAGRCAAVAERPPETFAEALQLMWLVGHVYCSMLAANPTLTFGRMDELLGDFYRADRAAGRLTREEAGELIEDFYCKNNLLLGRGEHQMSGGSEKSTGWLRNLCYDAPQYVVLGGQRADGSAVANELTELFLERIVPRFENPVIVLRYTSDLPAEVWRLACDKMRANASFMVYNDHAVIPAMIHCGIAPRDAVTYTMHGCNWPDIPGTLRTTSTSFISLPGHFLKVLLGSSGEAPPRFAHLDEVYDRYAASIRAEVEEICTAFRRQRAEWDARAPGTLRVDDCFLDGPIARARSGTLGGTPYTNLVCALASPATAADCFAALEELVFRGNGTIVPDYKQVPLETLQAALREDFAGYEALRQWCLHAPKFGQDDPRTDAHAVRLLELVSREIDAASRLGTPDAIPVFRCTETDMRHLHFGRETGATPDGRRAGQPTSENTSPTPGSCTRGLTALFRSLAQLPFHRIHSGALNVRLPPRLVAGEEGLTRLAALLRTYFEEGGLQVQLSLADTAQLRAAQAQPEAYRDLMVRITGYSAAFVDMSQAAQEEIIRRAENAEIGERGESG